MVAIPVVKSMLGGDVEPGERPGVLEKLIEVLGPQIGTIIGNIKGISDNYTQVNAVRAQQGLQPLPLPSHRSP